MLIPLPAKRPARSSCVTGGLQASRASRMRSPMILRWRSWLVFFIKSADFACLTSNQNEPFIYVNFPYKDYNAISGGSLRPPNQIPSTACQTFLKCDSVCRLGDKLCHAIQGTTMNYLFTAANLVPLGRSLPLKSDVRRRLPHPPFNPLKGD